MIFHVMTPTIKGFIENTLLDWEGKLACVLFLPGCNFRCSYCHARHLLEPGASNEAIPLEAVMMNLRRQRGWIDGVVISGGEPTLHPGLPDFIRMFREEGFAVKLDTNGSRPDALRRLFDDNLLDYVAMDVKAPFDERYEKVVGAPVHLDNIRESVRLIMESGLPYEFRTTVCPIDLEAEDVERIAEGIAGARLYYLQAFRPVNCLDESLENVRPYNPEQMRELCKIASPFVQRCVVRGDSASELVTSAQT